MKSKFQPVKIILLFLMVNLLSIVNLSAVYRSESHEIKQDQQKKNKNKSQNGSKNTYQIKSHDNNDGKPVLSKLPEFPGGEKAMKNYITKSVKYPEDAAKERIEGTVKVSFVVTKYGKITMVEVIQGVNPGLNAEAYRVVRNMPDWKPGQLENGDSVAVEFTIPIKFGLMESNFETIQNNRRSQSLFKK